jgi:glycosyltransferase involved in cell wall biosynthesis
VVFSGSEDSVLIVIPAFNEVHNISPVIDELKNTNSNFSILVVDDGSTDGTFQAAQKMGVNVARLPFNLGVGAAMRLGFRYAEMNGYSKVIQLDADGQHVPSCIESLLEALEGSDIVVGSRFAEGAVSFDVGRVRRFAMQVLAFSLSRLTKTKLTDVTSGFRASGPRAIQLFSTSYPPEYLGDTIESLVIAHRNGLSIGEIPTTIRARISGSSSQSSLRALIYTIRALAVLALSILHRQPASRL